MTPDDVTVLVLVVLCFMLYFLPTIVAGFYRNINFVSIGVLNLFLGWTFVGWVIALVWAVKQERNPYES